jgi:hypothetical protein
MKGYWVLLLDLVCCSSSKCQQLCWKPCKPKAKQQQANPKQPAQPQQSQQLSMEQERHVSVQQMRQLNRRYLLNPAAF